VQREELLEAIMPLPVWDTHTHLQGATLAARSFWDIGHYFWFLRELLAAGYPANYRSLGEAERISAYVRAYQGTRNTSMHWVVGQIFRTLYRVEIGDEASIRAADEAVRAAAGRADWPQQVCRPAAIQRIVVNTAEDVTFAGLPGTSSYVPRVEEHVVAWLARLASADAGAVGAVGDAVAAEISSSMAGYAAGGCGGVITSLEPFGTLDRSSVEATGRQTPAGPDPVSRSIFVLRSLCRAAEEHRLFLQLFSGIEPVWGAGRVPVNDSQRLLPLYGLFREYACAFELVLGSSVDNLDAVQAATIFPNVYVGGMWWYNFRASTYRASMQYRLEGLPPSKSVLVVSDARCIEWCYGKVLLVKHLLADVLHDQIQRGWLGRDDALWLAREWLYGAAAARYDGPAAGR
jgi:glucuronate isomerase